jgi:hypothetical protein
VGLGDGSGLKSSPHPPARWIARRRIHDGINYTLRRGAARAPFVGMNDGTQISINKDLINAELLAFIRS